MTRLTSEGLDDSSTFVHLFGQISSDRPEMFRPKLLLRDIIDTAANLVRPND